MIYTNGAYWIDVKKIVFNPTKKDFDDIGYNKNQIGKQWQRGFIVGDVTKTIHSYIYRNGENVALPLYHNYDSEEPQFKSERELKLRRVLRSA